MIDTPINTNALQEQLDALLARAGEDGALHARLLADPDGAVRDAGIVLPPGASLLVRPNAEGLPHVTVQAAPETDFER